MNIEEEAYQIASLQKKIILAIAERISSLPKDVPIQDRLHLVEKAIGLAFYHLFEDKGLDSQNQKIFFDNVKKSVEFFQKSSKKELQTSYTIFDKGKVIFDGNVPKEC